MQGQEKRLFSCRFPFLYTHSTTAAWTGQRRSARPPDPHGGVAKQEGFMKSSFQRVALACVCCVVFGLPAAAQEAAPAASLDRKVLDEHVYRTLRDVINIGKDLYNNGDWAGCYRLFQGSLITIRPLLDHRPELQKVIEDTLLAAEGKPKIYERAKVLRVALDRIRADLNPTRKPPEDVLPRPQVNTLWNRLGGEEGVTKVVDAFAEAAAGDPQVDLTRGGKYPIDDPKKVAELKKSLVDWISSKTGGPLKYTGPNMKEVHKGMGITDVQFNAAAADLKKALDDNGVKPADVAALLKIVDGTRKDIVEAKPAEEVKPELKLDPDDKKPEDKKLDDPR